MRSSLLCALFALLVSPSAYTQNLNIPLSMGGPEAWLVTYSPGEVYWQRFGHNAIWLRDPSRGIDHVFNSGFFDFKQENFFSRFVQGRMLYFSNAQPVEQEFRQYQLENRGILVQKLDLDFMQYERLAAYLLQQVQLESRDYLYDYYLDNCSTRMRDALDVALDGRLRPVLSQQAAGQNFRAHTRRSVALDFWYYLALESVLALPVDRAISRWDEMFLPAVVSQVAREFKLDDKALVSAEHTVFTGGSFQAPVKPPQVWWHYLGAGTLLMLFFGILGRFAGPVMSRGSVNAWLMIAGGSGCLLLYLWLLTNHQAAGPNINVLLMNPLFLLGLWRPLRSFAAILLAGGLVLAVIQALVPAGQFNLDVLSFVFPLNAACAYWLWQRSNTGTG